MTTWVDVVNRIESLEDVSFNQALIEQFETLAHQENSNTSTYLDFFTPSFKQYSTSELSPCGKNAWPAISITGSDCKLQCDHCKAKILEPMIPAKSPESLWSTVNGLVESGVNGILLTGGSNHRNEVEYEKYYSTIRRIKDVFPGFKVALHTALISADVAVCMEQSGIDVAMMDVIGSQKTITQVYHLKRSRDDFESSLANLTNTKMRVVPHIVIGLHYGKLLGEWYALRILQRYKPNAVVLVVAMPQYATRRKKFENPDSCDVGSFFIDAKVALPDVPIFLGCARPPGLAKTEIDSYAVMAGITGIAHPADGVIELAARLEKKIRVSSSCCSIGLTDEVLGYEKDLNRIELDLDAVIAHERQFSATKVNNLLRKINVEIENA